MNTITPEFASELIDFAPPGGSLAAALGRTQLEGTVAIYNMLARNRCAYLADEVGMGKTYIALGVMGLLRYANPRARVLIIAPRENIQLKWRKELLNFARLNWKHRDNRVRSVQDEPVREPVVCSSLATEPGPRQMNFVREALLQPDRDFLLRMTSFSLALREDAGRARLRKALRHEIPWLPGNALAAKSFEGFRDAYGCALNAALSEELDLVIVDEAHNLKHGFSEGGSIRNRIMGLFFGHPDGCSKDRPWYRTQRAKRVLLLSATPFEDDYGAIARQLDVFGFGAARLFDAGGAAPASVADLARGELSDREKRDIVRRIMVRRVASLEVGKQRLTRNMYRREWRRGGYEAHDEAMRISDPKQRLVVALMQKKVAEILQDERFNNHFQIGMLSSFESFLESVETARRRRATRRTADGEEEIERIFDGDQTDDERERRGIDSEAIAEVLESYQSRFKEHLPHPKLDATAKALETCFDTGEKTLVFVRRVRTVHELAARMDRIFDGWIRRRMEEALPELRARIEEIFDQYERDRRRRPDEQIESQPVDQEERDSTEADELRHDVDEDDRGSAETFFAWFFRGKGPPRVLSGAAYQKNRFGSFSHPYGAFFEDNYVAWLLGYPTNVLAALAERVGNSPDACAADLRWRAFGYFRTRVQQRDRYPFFYVFESYQIAGLEMLADVDDAAGAQARIVRAERFVGGADPVDLVPEGFPQAPESLETRTFFTELACRPALRASLWPEESSGDFRRTFLRREQRRELLSAMARLGAAYVDLYLLAVRGLDSLARDQDVSKELRVDALAKEFADLLERQATTPGFHAYSELSKAADAFDLLVSVNFPTVPGERLPEIASIYGNDLQKQVPVGTMEGGVNKRLVKQFRMPGFPLVLITTDVLQEGEDLHTFCSRIVHYGITWTASAMEQRTGRIDRIGSLVQRRLRACPGIPTAEDFIQVYYPHLMDTVEVLQVRRVLKRLNRFFQLIHETGRDMDEGGRRIDAAREMLEDLRAIEQFTQPLQSAFPIEADSPWLDGALSANGSATVDFAPWFVHFDDLWSELEARSFLRVADASSARCRHGRVTVALRDGAEFHQAVSVEIRSRASGAGMILRVRADTAKLDLNHDDAEIERLWDAVAGVGAVRVCVWRNEAEKLNDVAIEGDLLLSPESTQFDEVLVMVQRIAGTASVLHEELSGSRGSRRVASRTRRRKVVPAADSILAKVDALIRGRKLPWSRRGHTVTVEVGGRRQQRVELLTSGDFYVFRSMVLRSSRQPSRLDWRDLAYRTWRRNTMAELVAFAFDERDALVGIIEQPMATLDHEELQAYVGTLAVECDRMEYALTGEDVW